MIYPTIDELTKGKFNRYELVVGVSKSARIVTDEYVEMRAKAQKMIDNRETDKPLSALIDPEGRFPDAVCDVHVQSADQLLRHILRWTNLQKYVMMMEGCSGSC